MADPAALLDTLRPLREPPAPASIVPYLVMAVLGALVAMTIVHGASLVMAARRRIRRAAEAELARSRALPPPERLAAQARLLRRLARATSEADARQRGAEWLARLDRLFATSFFSQGEGRVFGAALYGRDPRVDVELLDRALSRFVARVRR